MKSKNKSPCIYSNTVLKETSSIVSVWIKDMEKIIFLSDELNKEKGRVILEIALESEISDFLCDLEDSPIGLEDGDAEYLVGALTERIQNFVKGLASDHGLKTENTQDALEFLSKKALLPELRKYLEDISEDLKDLMKG